jgi:hypothetical protein
MKHTEISEDNFLLYFNVALVTLSRVPSHFPDLVLVKYPLLEMLEARSVSDFRCFQIWRCLHRLHWLSILNLKPEIFQNPKLF